jgi:hypothetical protein
MELNLMGDYYEWYCDWCDTLNVTLIHRVIDGTFHCCACHKQVLCDTQRSVPHRLADRLTHDSRFVPQQL